MPFHDTPQPLTPPTAAIGRRVALVIGNAAYQVERHVLANPANDARGIAEALTRIGFSGVAAIGDDFTVDHTQPGVSPILDVDNRRLGRALAALARACDGVQQAVIYYAGHGIEVAGENYLIPIDAKLAHLRDAEFEMQPLTRALGTIDGATGLKLVILDACRNNPFRARLFAGRDVSRGLRGIEPPGNVLVAYAAKHGTTASDGAKGANSPFASALLAHIEKPGLEVVELFREVKDDVLDATSGEQEPYLYGSLGRRREYFVPPAPSVPAVSETPPPLPIATLTDQPPVSDFSEAALFERAAIEHWGAVKGTADPARLRTFLADYGTSRMGPLAREALQRLATAAWRKVAKRDPAAIAHFIEDYAGTAEIVDASALKAKLEAARLPRREDAGDRADVRSSPRWGWLIGTGMIAALAAAWVGLATVGAPVWMPWDPAPGKPTVASSAPSLSKPSETEVKPKSVAAVSADPVASLEPGSGQSARDCAECPEMVVVPAGKFMMGSPAGEEGRSSDEGPQHMVTIAQPFAVGRFAVTFDEWEACVKGGGCQTTKEPSDQGWGKGRRPVINVSWNDAKEYVTWLSKKTGKTYRLLSEAEREYVTRAGTTTRFWWGTSISTSEANYNGNYSIGGSPKGEYRGKTVPVDSFQPNPWGLYQVHGNVYDWVEDCWHDSYSGAPADGSAWTKACTDYGLRVLRGGSWLNGPQLLRSAFRNWNQPDVRYYNLGFRLARTLNP